MKRTVLGLAICFSIIAPGCSASNSSGSSTADAGSGRKAAPATNAEKIVGIWTMKKINGKEEKFKTQFEYTSDGKVRFPGGPPLGTFTVVGDLVTITPDGEKSQVEKHVIKKLDANNLVLFDEKNKQEVEYTK